MPTLEKTHWKTITSLGTVDRHLEALLFAIYYSAVISLSSEQCLKILDETREAVLSKYRFAVEHAFAQGNLLGTQDMTLLQAAVLFLSALPNEDDSRAVWALTSLVFHIARTMGLHRDGTAFGLKPFETELRRRIWWQICIIDSRSSEHRCNEPIAQGFITDTNPPLHVNDVDLSADMLQPPTERWDSATDMTLSLVRCDTIQTGSKLSRISHRQNNESGNLGTPGSCESPDPFTQRLALIQDLEMRIRDKYLPICDSSAPFQLLASAVARIILGRFKLMTQYSEASQDNQGNDKTPNGTAQPKDNMRDELFETSIGILEMSGMLLTNKDLMHFTWYSKTHIQWNAMAFVLSELCTRAQSLQCDRAWNCVQIVYEAWKLDGDQKDESRLALWRPIRRLMAKARYVRELQRTDPGQPLEAKHKFQVRDPISCTSLPQTPFRDWSQSLQGAAIPMATPETSFTGLHFISSGSDQPDVSQGVFSTDTLSPYMDFISQWPLTAVDNNLESALVDYNIVV
ncbi:hypothetical protein KCV07_g9087, partial [Aureobasidium melanogenum]